jgi:phosphoribosylformylglycinamidine cyclo-ligase
MSRSRDFTRPTQDAAKSMRSVAIRPLSAGVSPPPQDTAHWSQVAALSDQEAYGTFNMGAGFAVFVHPTDVEEVIRVAASVGVQATHAGSVESGGKRVIIEPIDVQFDASELQLRV